MPKDYQRPRRSCLYMPGANQRALGKAANLPADVLLLDLEDAVTPDAKVSARQAVCDAVRSGAYGAREVVVRVNALATPWGHEDLVAAIAAGADGILAPKVERAEDVEELDAALAAAGAGERTGLWVMIETPLGVLSLREIAACAPTTRLSALVVGTNDLAKEMQIQATPDRLGFLAPLTMTVLAARANGLSVLDGVYNDIADAAGFEAEARQGLALGFDGKTLIHPSQLALANEVFGPTADALADAEAVIAAFQQPENRDVGVIKVNGRMTERLHLEQALHLVALRDAIATLESG